MTCQTHNEELSVSVVDEYDKEIECDSKQQHMNESKVNVDACKSGYHN